MISDALAARFDIVLVHKFDRFARNRADAAVYKSLLRDNGIQVISVTEQFDASTPAGMLVEGILEVIAEWYRHNLAQEVRKGMAQKIRAGGWPYPAPFGYKNVRRGNLAWIEPSEFAPCVTLAFEQFATGKYTLSEWTKEARRLNIRNRDGNFISRSRWAHIFRNSFYIGKVRWEGQEYPGTHPPLVDPETFQRVQHILDEHNVHSSHFTWKHKYMLRLLLWDKDTQSPCSGMVAKRKFRYYVSARPLPNGKRKYLPADDLESKVEKLLHRVVINNHKELPPCEREMYLALRVAPNIGSIMPHLDYEGKMTLCTMVFKKRGIIISGEEIETANLKVPFVMVSG